MGTGGGPAAPPPVTGESQSLAVTHWLDDVKEAIRSASPSLLLQMGLSVQWTPAMCPWERKAGDRNSSRWTTLLATRAVWRVLEQTSAWGGGQERAWPPPGPLCWAQLDPQVRGAHLGGGCPAQGLAPDAQRVCGKGLPVIIGGHSAASGWRGCSPRPGGWDSDPRRSEAEGPTG